MNPQPGIQILHLSMPRTGSTSMKAAYEELGLPTYHAYDFLQRPRDQIRWSDAVNAKCYGKGKPFGRQEFDEILSEYAVVSDFPAITFTKELLEAYPEAKVVLVHRDMDKWYKSFNEGIMIPFFGWKVWVIRNLVEPFRVPKPTTTMYRAICARLDSCDQRGWQNNARRVSRENSARLKAVVPRDRLLEYELGSGWEPLCRFLGKEVPDKPFPHLNDSAEFRRRTNELQARMLRRGLFSALKFLMVPALVGCIGIAWLYLGKA